MFRHCFPIGLLLGALAVVPARFVSAQVEVPRRVSGHGFSIPIPPGFSPVDSAKDEFARQVWTNGGVMIAQDHAPPVDNPELAVIIVAPSPGGELANADSCAAFARSQTRSATLATSGIAVVGARQACRFTATRSTDVPGVTASQLVLVASVGDHRLTFVCNYDPRDTTAMRACDYALNGWQFTEAPRVAH